MLVQLAGGHSDSEKQGKSLYFVPTARPPVAGSAAEYVWETW